MFNDPKNPQKFLTLNDAAQKLSVTVETLLDWNDNNILKPTITQEGNVGYTDEQINKFLAVQQLIQQSSDPGATSQHTISQTQSPVESHLYNNVNLANVPQVYIHTDNPKQKLIGKSKKISNKFYIFASISAFLLVIVLTVTISSPSRNNSKLVLNDDFDQSTSTGSVSDSQVDDIGTIKHTDTLKLPTVDKYFTGSNPPNTGLTVPENILANPFSIFDRKSTLEDTENRILSVPPFLAINNNDSSVEVRNFASKPSLLSIPNNEKTVFDDDGNIKGQVANSDILATTLGTSVLQKGQPMYRTANSGILFTSLVMGSLWFIYVFKRQPAYSIAKQSSPNRPIPTSTVELQIQKVLEVKQKTDGSVVLLFQGNEYKISKPELNSETDRFIERLMSLTKDDIKKIEYDILKDEDMRLNAPLSKLVTRLGFAGLKRDLFFPRTSKNKVLFRRYITKQDLASMGLTSDQLHKELYN